MSRFNVSREIDAPPERIWQQLSDYGGIASWNPNLSASRLLDGSPATGRGALRQCEMTDGKNWIRERVVEWREGEGYTVDIYEGTMPLKRAGATLSIRPSGAGRSVVTMELDYEPKPGLLGAIMNALMMKGMMRRTAERLLAGLDDSVKAPQAA